MSKFNFFFKNREKNNPLDEKKQRVDVLDKIIVSINENKTQIRQLEKETEQIKKWANEAIQESYHVPGDFWYVEYENYNNIKEHELNSNADIEVFRKCDEIILAYSEQIEIKKTKIEFFEALISKYKETKQKLQKIAFDKEKISKLEKLERHKRRIESLSKNLMEMDETYGSKNNLNDIEENVQELIDEYEINEEVKAQLELLNKEYNSSTQIDSYIFMKEEIKKLTKQILHQNKDS